MYAHKFFRLSLSTLLLGLMGTGALGQIQFKDAFPGVKFAEPVYFGVFPGKPKAFAVLEQHKGLALILYQDGTNWVRDTLVKIDVNSGGEMGFLGIAFHPQFNTNHKFYVSYDPAGALFNIVEERIADATGMKDSGTKPRTLFKITDPYSNHNGGTIAFGPKDGLLYFGTGDGGGAGDPQGNSQNPDVLLGKFLRIDVDRQDAGLEYGIPSDNPYAKGGGRPEVFAIGLRNSWKWSFDPLNGDLWAGDVGQNRIEETDIIVLGGNYGWKSMEGPDGTNNGKMILPVHSYPRSVGTSVIGGVVFRGNPGSKYYGTYFTTDIYSRKFWALKKNGTGLAGVEELPMTPTGMSSFGTDAEGRIYMVGHTTGIIYLLDSPDLTPTVSIRKRGGAMTGKYGRSFMSAPGARLNAELFARWPVLELFTTGGVRLGVVTRNHPNLPATLDAGVYLLRPETLLRPESGALGPASGAALPDLILVR